MANKNQNVQFKVQGDVVFSHCITPQYWDNINKKWVHVDLKKNPDQINRQGLSYSIEIANPVFEKVDPNDTLKKKVIDSIKLRIRKGSAEYPEETLSIPLPVINQAESSKPANERHLNTVYYADRKTKTYIKATNNGKEVGHKQKVTIMANAYPTTAQSAKKYNSVAIRLNTVVFDDIANAQFYTGQNGLPSELAGYKEVDDTASVAPTTENSMSDNSQTATESAQSATSDQFSTADQAEKTSNSSTNDPFGVNEGSSDNSDPFGANSGTPFGNGDPTPKSPF